jgi:hypothetical protein
MNFTWTTFMWIHIWCSFHVKFTWIFSREFHVRHILLYKSWRNRANTDLWINQRWDQVPNRYEEWLPPVDRSLLVCQEQPNDWYKTHQTSQNEELLTSCITLSFDGLGSISWHYFGIFSSFTVFTIFKILIPNFFGLSITDETLLVKMCIWCIKIGIVLVLQHLYSMYIPLRSVYKI